MSYKGRFVPTRPDKYRGDPTKITYRSMWEFKFFRFIDVHPHVNWWQSEEIAIPYLSPIDGKMHRYFPDIIVNKQVDDQEQTLMIEIKPAKQTVPPNIANKNKTKTGRISRRYLNEVKTYGVNEAKWIAANKYCEARGWKFLIYTEKELGIGKV